MKNAKVAITGGGGFLGNVLTRHLLNNGYSVKVMDNMFKGNCDALLSVVSNPNFEFMKGDIRDKNDCKKLIKDADYIVHLAGVVGFPACKKDVWNSYSINVEGTRTLMNQKDKDQFLVNASTGSVYGVVEGVCTEESPLNYQSEYGEQKAKGEKIVSEYENTVSYRFATAFGSSPNTRINLLINDFVHRALSERCLNVFQADFQRTFIHINDIARAFEHAFVNRLDGVVYNCGSSKLNWSKRQVAEYIREKTGCYVFYDDFAEDLDKRNYSVNYGKIEATSFKCEVSMEQGVDELIKASQLININHQYN